MWRYSGKERLMKMGREADGYKRLKGRIENGKEWTKHKEGKI